MAEFAGDPAKLPTVIPNASEVEQMGLYRAPIVARHPKSRSALAFTDLWKQIGSRLDVKANA